MSVKPMGTEDRALADAVELSSGWNDRARRLRDEQTGQQIIDLLRTRTDGIPSTTFCGFQLQADAV